MKPIRTITITDWTLGEPSTAFEYKIKYSPDHGVTEIISVHAAQEGCPSIDITFNLVHRFNLDQSIEDILGKDKLEEAYANHGSEYNSPFFAIAARAMKYSADNY